MEPHFKIKESNKNGKNEMDLAITTAAANKNTSNTAAQRCRTLLYENN